MTLANSFAFLLYLCCGALLTRRFVDRDIQNAPSYSINLLIVIALIAHAIDITLTMKSAGGWDLGLFSTLAVVSWLMAFITFVLGSKLPKSHPGIVIFPLVALSLMLKTSLPTQQTSTLTNPALEWHILLSLAAYSLFTLAAIQAIILAIQEQHLRKPNSAGFLRKLPPLQLMESGLFQLISTGFILLTTGLFTGFLFLDNLFAQHLIHKTALSLISWSVFATLLWGRRQYGWRGKTAIKWTLIGFSFLVLAYFGSKFVLEYLINSSSI